MHPPADLMRRFGAREPHLVAETAAARVWRVRTDGGSAALKLYRRRDMGNEAAGFDWMRATDGRACARILAAYGHAALIEWLDGPSLGDLVRAGCDDAAGRRLARVARRLHGAPPRPMDLPDLGTWFASFDGMHFSPACPAPDLMRRAAALAREMLATTTEWRPLHGDLHHDNARRGARGWCAFDAKGVRGDPAYEMANALRNPRGAAEIIRTPGRIDAMTTLWAQAMGVPRIRLARWAAAKCALSIRWTTGPRVIDHPDFDLLALLMSRA
ncbi:aminoglycoside phosphotransferase family protein [Jannaschia aquimarina]|uniref:Aminoglycoside/hydroxyurea antibiotic resistance kinase n=1 Tax=Jannaschia aquimarina TaxID=935700 RepID=A0A0D1DDH0_9RHOB|nr:aminoglycoside phosphotransferase family protein [Jannaschia aquimarina]KIT18038.1 Aminoglycoside/hydroxyurea antibiotic resistance kinase [Jannaschia aquimarina]SNS89039.1 streptomycin 6-kinase [Jannaschia aquimarina]